ncbi:MAG: hypothetical protein RI947_1265 [Candidatus Parcubacteria bacterium]|jgi:hypothetical protein
MVNAFPPYLVAVDNVRKRIFVMAKPYLSALLIDGEWQYVQPLPDEEIKHYQLVTDPETALKYVEEAREALLGGIGSNDDKIN